MSRQSPDLFAAIHVGSEQIIIEIVEFTSMGDIRVIERASRQVTLGEETFKTGRISFQAVSEVCELLKGFRRLMSSYGVREHRLIATTAIREAKNQHYIIDQIRIKTGFEVEILDLPHEIFHKYCSLFHSIRESSLLAQEEGMLFVDISSGGLGIILYKGGSLLYQQNIHIGTLRIKESFDKWQREASSFHQALSEFIYSSVEPVERELKKYKIRYLNLSGLETRLLLKMLGRDPEARLSTVPPKEFHRLYDKVRGLNLPQIMQTFGLSETTAEIVLPTIVLYRQILSLINVDEIVVLADKVIDGVIMLHIAEKSKDRWLEVIEGQILSLVDTIGRKYQYDYCHSRRVEELAVMLFDRLSRVHGLGKRERLLLRLTTILHDVGKYVSLRKHYFYSYRLILSSDILGISEREKAILANVAYYHSRETPTPNHTNFATLETGDKVLVAKLSALIRLADALDRSHRQKIRDVEISLRGEEMVVRVKADEDLSLEEWTFADKAEFFEEVFGIRVILERIAG